MENSLYGKNQAVLVESFKEYYLKRLRTDCRDVKNLTYTPMVVSFRINGYCSLDEENTLKVLFGLCMHEFGRIESNDDRIDYLDYLIDKLRTNSQTNRSTSLRLDNTRGE